MNMQKMYVVGAQGYTDSPIAVFDERKDADEFARLVWPLASDSSIEDKIHEVVYIMSTKHRADILLQTFNKGLENQEVAF